MKFLLAALNAKYIHSNPALYSLRAYAGKIPSGGSGTGGACRVYDQSDGGGNPCRSL